MEGSDLAMNRSASISPTTMPTPLAGISPNGLDNPHGRISFTSRGNGWPYFGTVTLPIFVSVHLGYRAMRQDACPVRCQQGLEVRTEQAPRRALPHRRR